MADPLVSEAYVYLLRVATITPPVVVVQPSANIPRVLLPAADPALDATLDAAAEQFVSFAYMYLFRVATVEEQVLEPKANIPRVLLPAADAHCDTALDDVARLLLSQANVYLLRVVDTPTPVTVPSANIPTVPGARPAFAALHPQLLAEVAPNAIGDGIALGSLKLG